MHSPYGIDGGSLSKTTGVADILPEGGQNDAQVTTPTPMDSYRYGERFPLDGAIQKTCQTEANGPMTGRMGHIHMGTWGDGDMELLCTGPRSQPHSLSLPRSPHPVQEQCLSFLSSLDMGAVCRDRQSLARSRPRGGVKAECDGRQSTSALGACQSRCTLNRR